MVDENILLRNSRHLLLNELNEDSIKFLLESRILIVGAGGLGCPAALYLATAGVKNISCPGALSNIRCAYAASVRTRAL